MKTINKNRADLLLLFTRKHIFLLTYEELEYYMSDDEKLLGIILKDHLDNDYNYVVLARNTKGEYQFIYGESCFDTIEEARTKLSNFFSSPIYDKTDLQKGLSPDFFNQVVKKEQENPNYKLLCESKHFSPAKKCIEELAHSFTDKDGNFVDQFQSKNGFDARIWELFLRCFFKDEQFEIDETIDVPDFVLEKMDERITVEAVVVPRDKKAETGNDALNLSLEEIFNRLDNDMPLKFGSSLYSKAMHTCKGKKYWELPSAKGKPFLCAIADFHADYSMTWSFPAIISILYGVDYSLKVNNLGLLDMELSSEKKFIKSNGAIIEPLFNNDEFENISAILFAANGTLSKFNRMGKQAGLGSKDVNLIHIKTIYNHKENAVLPNIESCIIDENCNERWGDGVSFFHNPKAKYPLDPNLFPNCAHHFFVDGALRSYLPPDFCLSSFVYNIRFKESEINDTLKRLNYRLNTNLTYDNVIIK